MYINEIQIYDSSFGLLKFLKFAGDMAMVGLMLEGNDLD